nr:hypothetical protein [Tanacetum cinerariifolium]
MSMLKKHQLTGPYFNKWFCALKLVVLTEKLHDVFETALSPARAAGADAQALADWVVLFYRYNEVACLMLETMSPRLYHLFKHNSPLEMVTELQKMYGKPSGVELQELVNMFHSCKHTERQYVSDHVQLIKSYLDQLATLNYAFPDKVSISFILNSHSSEFQAFVQNYNMQSMEKTISEVRSLLIEFEKSIKRNKQPIVGASSTPQVMAIQCGRVQKYKPQGKAKKKGKGKEMKRMQNVPYASVVGSIMYAVRCTRPDVTFAQNITRRFQQNSGDTKSQTRYVFILNGGAVVWKSLKQSTTAQHVTEDEYIASSEAAKEAVWIRKFIDELGVVPLNNYLIKMNCDNSAAIIMAKESGIQKGAKQFKTKYHYVCECIETGEINIVKVYTRDNLDDLCMKALAGPKLTQQAKSMGLRLASSFM